MKKSFLRIATIFILVFGLLCPTIAPLTGYAHIDKPDACLMQEGFQTYRAAKDFSFANPVFVSGAGTNLFADGSYYNLIESDYYKTHKDAALTAAYEEYSRDYQSWLSAPDTAPTEELKQQQLDDMLFNADGIFKAFRDDYTNPAKVVYLTVIATSADAAEAIATTDGVQLIYTGEEVPCVVIRFQGDAELFNKIIDDPDVLFVAPAFGESLNPYHTVNILAAGTPVTRTSGDARDILRYSVGLSIDYETAPLWSIDDFSRRAKTSEKWFFISADLNFDGHITPEDARLALRIAVGLDEAPILDTDI